MLPLARFLSSEQTTPNGSKSAAGLSPVIELKNEFTGDLERSWQGNHWSARAIGSSRRIVSTILILLC